MKVPVVLAVPGDIVAPPHRQPLGHPTARTPTLLEGARFYLVEADRGTVRFVEKDTPTDAGAVTKATLSFRVSPFSPEQLDLRRRLRDRRVHALFTDRLGRTRWQAFAQTSLDSDTGEQRSDYNRGDWTLKSSNPYPAPFLDLPLDLTGVTVADGALILIHPADGSKWRVGVDGRGSLVTTRVDAPGGVTSIPIDLHELRVDDGDGSLGTYP